MRSVELVTEDVNRGNPLDVILCAEVGGQKATKLQQCVMTLQEDKEFTEQQKYTNNYELEVILLT